MNRKISKLIYGTPAIDGAGVKLVRVLGHGTTEEFDPILMLDSFDSVKPEDYTNGFPFHPHRGIETISYVAKGNMRHRDNLGFEDTIGDGELQWMTAGSGILHEETLPASERLLGVQLWLNLPADKKMTDPEYHSIKNGQIKDIPFDGGVLRLLTGNYLEHSGFQPKHLPFDYYDIHLNPGASITIPVDDDRLVMLFTLSGEAIVADQIIPEKTAAKLTAGSQVTIQASNKPAQVLFMSSQPLHQPIAWGGPIVMNDERELYHAFDELQSGTFIKKSTTEFQE